MGESPRVAKPAVCHRRRPASWLSRAIGQHVGQLLRDQLVGRQWPAERLAVERALPRAVEAVLGRARATRASRSGTSVSRRGATHPRFAPDDRIAEHRDYWDTAEALYEKLPPIGALMSWLRRRAAA
jgi:hypothetical protein